MSFVERDDVLAIAEDVVRALWRSSPPTTSLRSRG